MFKSLVRAILVTLGLIALLAIVGAGIFHFKVIKPFAQRTVVKNPDDLAFVGGLVAFSCLFPDILPYADDIDATIAMTENLKERGEKCTQSVWSFAGCATSVAQGAWDTDTRARAINGAKKAERAYEGVHRTLVSASRIARNLPDYDDNTRAVKTVLITVITHFAQMDMLDLLRLDEKELDAWIEATLAPYGDQLEKWTDDAEKRYDGLEQITNATLGAHYISPMLSSAIIWDLNQYGFDETLQRAPSFKFARQRGCLQGATLFDAAMHLIQTVEKAVEKAEESSAESSAAAEEDMSTDQNDETPCAE